MAADDLWVRYRYISKRHVRVFRVSDHDEDVRFGLMQHAYRVWCHYLVD